MKKLIRAAVVAVSLCVSPLVMADIVNINIASAEELSNNLTGVGQKKAEAIIAYRKEFGDFKTLDEIMEVKGIGEGIFKKIKADLSLSDAMGSSTSSKAAADAKSTSKTMDKDSAAQTAVAQPAKKKTKKTANKDAATKSKKVSTDPSDKPKQTKTEHGDKKPSAEKKASKGKKSDAKSS